MLDAEQQERFDRLIKNLDPKTSGVLSKLSLKLRDIGDDMFIPTPDGTSQLQKPTTLLQDDPKKLSIQQPLIEHTRDLEASFVTTLYGVMQARDIELAIDRAPRVVFARDTLLKNYQILCKDCGVRDPNGYAKRFLTALEHFIRKELSEKLNLEDLLKGHVRAVGLDEIPPFPH